MANVVPVHKKSDQQILEHFRPVSLFPICGKDFERLIYNSLFEYFIENNLISPNQSGFIVRKKNLEVLLRKGALKICCKFTREHPCRSAISVKLQSKFIEIAHRHGCSPVNLFYVFRTPFLRAPLDGCFCIVYSPWLDSIPLSG